MARSRFKRIRQPSAVRNVRTASEDFGEPILGFDTQIANDNLPRSKWRLSQDARMVAIGDYRTRRGADFYTIPVGEANIYSNTATTGAGTQSIDIQNFVAQQITATGDPITRVRVNIANPTNAPGVASVTIRTDSAGAPGTILTSSTVDPITTIATASYIDVYFANPVNPTGPTWVTFGMQEGGQGTLDLTTNVVAPFIQLSADSGQTWAAGAGGLNMEVFTATPGAIKGLTRVQRPSGTRHTFFAHGDSVYEVNDGTGVATAIDTGLDATAEKYRHQFVKDTLYYVNGKQKPRKYDFTTASEVTAANDDASNLIDHQGVMFYTSANDPTAHFFTEFLLYDEFDLIDGAGIIYADGPEQADPSTAYASLSNLIIFNRNNKFVLYGEEAANYQIFPAQGRAGTFSQESVTVHNNYAYFASDDGIYRTANGEDELISLSINDEYIALLNKENTVLEVHQNRLYVYYTPNGEVKNSKCWVYRLDYEFWESVDTDTNVGAAFSRYDGEDVFLTGSNTVGALYYNERPTNNYHNLGAPLLFELRTGFDHFGAPSNLKELRNWLPRFRAEGTGYTAQAGWSVEKNSATLFQDVTITSGGVKWDVVGNTWDSGLKWDGGSQYICANLYVPGDYKTIQLTYKHHAAYEPVEFQGHGLVVSTQRLK